MDLKIRQACSSDQPALLRLAQLAVAEIGGRYYTPKQVDKAIAEITKIDAELIARSSFYVANIGEALVGCGAWCKGGALLATTNNLTCASPRAETSAAALRSFFVHPQYARRGIARALFDRCIADARSAGCRRIEVLASAAARQVCLRLGFGNEREQVIRFADGVELASYHMKMAISDPE